MVFCSCLNCCELPWSGRPSVLCSGVRQGVGCPGILTYMQCSIGQSRAHFNVWSVCINLLQDRLPAVARLLQEWMQGIYISATFACKVNLACYRQFCAEIEQIIWCWLLAEPSKNLGVHFAVVEKLSFLFLLSKCLVKNVGKADLCEETLFSQ